MRILLDSNAYSLLVRGRPEVAAIARNAGEILMSTVVLGELLDGFRGGSRTEANIAEMRAFLDNPYVSLVPGAGRGGAVLPNRNLVARERSSHPSNDVWIAAHAMETGADLVSADGHFEYVNEIAWLRIPAT
ncbi:PIN domain-containing protein [Candidatus Palauibacter sp.]|uniref:PIN domain-containing protein n=1 Tax=Candidatus Palauibacter sp. TaxID=3101350 RepID=UPI003B5A1620